MAKFLPLVILFVLILLLIVLIANWFKVSKFKKIAKKNNVIVYGHKGKGKDLIFQWMTPRKKPYVSNTDYGGDQIPLNLTLMTDINNDFRDFINGDVHKANKIEKLEGVDWYISDSGVYLPSNEDAYLHKMYKSFPILFALSRHLYNSNIHCNIQELDRLWKPIREQADYYLRAIGTLKLPFLVVVRVIGYDNYNDAVAKLSPIKIKLFDKRESKAQKEIANSSRGEISKFFIVIPKWRIHYDTRAFHKIVFKEEAPKKESLLSRLLGNGDKEIVDE